MENEFIESLYRYSSKRVNTKLSKDGFTFEHNGNKHNIVWDKDSECVIDVVNGDWNGAHEFDKFDLECLLEQ